ncbi:MAG: NAD-dependent epimerase/dehydratase family protein [Clostridia bacterium]|nr:NAD-dependent epimerase/dehydratase family protein [Clostridia bacterium]
MKKSDKSAVKEPVSVVTGARGYVGFALVSELSRRPGTVRALLRRDSKELDEFGVEKVMGDVTDYGSLEKAFDGADTVYHVAGIVDIEGTRDRLVWAVNYEGTKNVVTACKKCGVKNLVFVSSVDCIPPLKGNAPIRELSSYDPSKLSDAYGKSKAAATQYCIEQSDENLKICIVQPSCCIGPDDNNGTNSVCTMIQLYLSGLFPVTLRFGGYNFVDVRDVAKGMIAAAEKGRGGECYFLCGDRLSVDEFIRTLAKIEGNNPPKIALSKSVLLKLCPMIEVLFKAAKLPPVLTPFSINKICENCNFSYEKAAKELGYKPMSAEDSLRDTVKWIKAHPQNSKSIDELAKNIEESMEESFYKELKKAGTEALELNSELEEKVAENSMKLKEYIASRKWRY